jgi:Na+/melibiose symporter-like transporter
MGIAYSIIDSTFNNFIHDTFGLSGLERSFLELPRELPGMLVIFASALLWFLCSRRLAATAMVLGLAGSLLIGFASPSYGIMLIWLFIYSLGQHIFLPLASSIGMDLAEDGKNRTDAGQAERCPQPCRHPGEFPGLSGVLPARVLVPRHLHHGGCLLLLGSPSSCSP